MTKDIRGLLFKKIDLLRSLFTGFTSTGMAYAISNLRGIQIARKCSFYGIPVLRRMPGSTVKIDKGCVFRSGKRSNLIGINRPCYVSTISREAKILIGQNCGFSGTVIGAEKSIVIGNNVRCGANTLITDSDWHSDDPRTGPPKEVIIEDHAWLGVNVVVLKGAKIGANTVIGANSLVTGEIPPNVIAAGNPCRVICEISSKRH